MWECTGKNELRLKVKKGLFEEVSLKLRTEDWVEILQEKLGGCRRVPWRQFAWKKAQRYKKKKKTTTTLWAPENWKTMLLEYGEWRMTSDKQKR